MHLRTTRRVSFLLPPRFLPAFIFFSVGCLSCSVFPNSPSFCAPSSFKSSLFDRSSRQQADNANRASFSARSSRPTGKKRQSANCSYYETSASYSYGKLVVSCCIQNGSMQGIIYDQDVEQLDKLLQLYKTYYIGNAKIKEITSNASIFVSAKYQMLLNRNTYIRLASEEEQLPINHAYQLAPFAQCPALADVSTK
ncbi:uncharacterized protein LOC142542034 [Primulina tabacum]|uniref:uncharacterized protein LOC142542034 n=1 Tax=Primulina tabacum TaxID=48773 RepID=UPI003F59E3B9